MQSLLAAPPASLDFYDVNDAAAFVHANINRWCRPTARRGAIVLSAGEREELHAEGMAIMVKLARDFRAHIDGYEHAGRFSGFAAMFLPRKLGDAWHRMHEEHQLITHNCAALGCGPECTADGKRSWLYGDGAMSIEQLSAEDGEGRGHEFGAAETPERAMPSLEQMLRAQYEERLDVAMRVAGLLGEGLTSDSDIAEVLGLTVEQVREARNDLQPAAQRLRTLSQR